MSNFVPTFPTATTPIPQFQQIINNWNALNTIFEKDHTFYTDSSASQGHHKQVFFNAPLAGLSPAPSGTQAGAFPKASAAPIAGQTQMVYNNTQSAPYLLSCVRAWANVNSLGVVQDGFNCSATRLAVGNYRVTFAVPLPDAAYAVIVSTQMTAGFGVGGIVGIDSATNANFLVNVRALSGGNVGVDEPFYFIVLRT